MLQLRHAEYAWSAQPAWSYFTPWGQTTGCRGNHDWEFKVQAHQQLAWLTSHLCVGLERNSSHADDSSSNVFVFSKSPFHIVTFTDVALWSHFSALILGKRFLFYFAIYYFSEIAFYFLGLFTFTAFLLFPLLPEALHFILKIFIPFTSAH